MRILIAEDDHEVAKAVKTVLEHHKYAVDMVHNGSDAVEYVLSGMYDAVILDIMMPGKDGLQVVRELRERGIRTPVLFLTARNELRDRVEGLNAGADDYLAKPFASTELLARLRALLRRSGNYVPDLLKLGNICLDCSTYTLSAPQGSVRLTNKEFQMLEYFLRNSQKVFSTTELMDRIWGWECKSDIHVVWTNVTSLRRKLHALGADVEIISIPNAGYRITEKAME